MQNTLEKTVKDKSVKDKLKPIVDAAAKRSLGFHIEKLDENIIDRLEKPVLRMKIDVTKKFKAAKRDFKRQFFSGLLRHHYGNISEVAKISGLDRRSVHRAVKELDIDIAHYRHEMIKPEDYTLEVVDEVVKDSLEDLRPIITPDKLNDLYKGIMETGSIKEIPLAEPGFEEAELEFERQYIEKAIGYYGNPTNASKKIGLRYETLIRKMKTLGI